jgi:HAD superfamily hydrolase (TIGR01509 family)
VSVALATGVRVRAAIFDFNGTVCDDEGLLYEIVRDILRPHGVDLDERTYFDELAGLADPELIAAALAREGVRVDAAAEARLVELRVSEYLRRAGADPPVRAGSRELIEALAGRVPLAVGSGALRAEVEHVLGAADLRRHFAVVVTAEDVERGKPDPETYVTCLERLNAAVGGEPVHPREVVVVEDSRVGVAAAQAAGMHAIAVLGTEPPERLAAADLVLPELGVGLIAG